MSILEDLSHLSYFTPEEQVLLDQMKDPVERATFVLQKIKQHDDLIETLRNMKRMMDETVKAISKDLR
jgi:hypothetical protein